MDDSIDCSSGDDSDTRETRARWRALAARVDRRGEEDRLSAQQALSSDSSTIPSARHATPITRDRSSSRTGQSTATLPDARHFASSLMASASISGGRAVRPGLLAPYSAHSPPPTIPTFFQISLFLLCWSWPLLSHFTSTFSFAFAIGALSFFPSANLILLLSTGPLA
jgi:hypothetical protein